MSGRPAHTEADWVSGAVLDRAADGPLTGSVAGRFATALHVEFAGFVVAVLPPGAPRLPNGVGVQAGFRNEIADDVGSAARLTTAGLDVGRLTIGWDRQSPPRWDAAVPRWGTTAREALEERATSLLAACPGTGGPIDPAEALSGIDGFESNHGGRAAIAAVLAAVGSRDPSTAARAGRGLVGRGPGLTPIGDDILAATALTVAAVGDGSGSAARQRAWLRALLPADLRKRTTAVSATLLELATEGLGMATLHPLLDPDPAPERRLADRVARLCRVGHTSGPAYATTVGAIALALASPSPPNNPTKETPCP